MKRKKLNKIFCSILMIMLFFVATGCAEKLKDGTYIKVSKAETVNMQYEDFNNGLVTLKIPKGWKVDVPVVDYIHYTFKVYNPNNTDYMFVFSLKLEGFLKSEKARSTFARLYPDSTFGKLSAIDPQTTEAFYKVWSNNAKLANELDFKYEYFPYLNEFTVVENLGQTKLGGDILRASFKNGKDEMMEGIFTTTIYSPGTYYMYGVDLLPLNAYHTIMMMAPEGDFNNWAEIYDYCIGTVAFTDTFMSGFNSTESALVSSVQANQKIYDEISDMIMDSWEKRSNSYDIISQKRSDATLGYERVYDTSTGDVYKAFNGFMDQYDGTKYQTITDDMYSSTISGYIEK